MRHSCVRALLVVLVACALGFLAGCAGMEYVGDKHYLFYHKELPEATRALEAARSAGRDKECPTQFSAAEALVKEAYDLYYSCHTKEAIARANEAIAATNALCPRGAEAPRPAPAPAAPAPSAAPPTISLSAASGSIQEGSCTALTWTTTNATSVSIDPGIGSVEASGSRQVCPTSTTRYTLTATGAGGTRSDSTTVDVSGKPAAPAAPIDRMTLHVNFDVDKSVIRKADRDELEKAAAFVRKYAGAQISIQGYTDSTGSEAYNQALSERRAAAVKAFLLANGATSDDKITSEGHGESNPIASNKTAEGRAKNRRVEVLIVSR